MTPYVLWQQTTLALLLLSLLVSGRAAAAPSEQSGPVLAGSADQKGTNGHPKAGRLGISRQDFLSAEEHPAATEHVQQAVNIVPELNYHDLRELQVGTDSFTPEGVCQSYADMPDFNETYACSCESFGNDIQVDCEYRKEQCNEDDSVCFVGSIQRILEVDTEAVPDAEGQVQLPEIAVTTCTRFTTTEDDDSETCIRIFPEKNGDFTDIMKCSVNYSPIAGEGKPGVCRECSVCETAGDSEFPSISFDCCNLETDLKQTCGPTSDGVAVPIFDEIPESEKGMCSGALAVPGPGFYSLFGAISFAATALYLAVF